MLKNVKNTMFRGLADTFAPHYCSSCGAIGSVLCEYCKYNIINEPFGACVVCGSAEGWRVGVCQKHRLPYSRAWCLGEKRAALEALIFAHKFGRNKDVYRAMVDLLDHTLPALPTDCVVVPVPTVAAHTRQRGYDHTALLARGVAARRGLVYNPVVRRLTTTRQHGATKKVRLEQARRAFGCGPLGGGTYLLVDDVLTTGATAQYAAQVLREAGADDVWLVVLARQPLEK